MQNLSVIPDDDLSYSEIVKNVFGPMSPGITADDAKPNFICQLRPRDFEFHLTQEVLIVKFQSVCP